MNQIKKLNRKKKTAFISGNFNVIHPGHFRLFEFAASISDHLTVGLKFDKTVDKLSEIEDRRALLLQIDVVNDVLIYSGTIEGVLEKLEPALVIKGIEFENGQNRETKALKKYGGKLIFGPGSARSYGEETSYFDETDPIFHISNRFIQKHQFDVLRLQHIVTNFSNLNITVMGDVILDRYVNCEPLGMSQEDPTIVVMPLNRHRFLGGAGIVAAHASGLGGKSSFFSVVGDDESATFVQAKAEEFGLDFNFFVDNSRTTPTKTRYRALEKTLLRVNELRQHNITAELSDDVFSKFEAQLDRCDLLIFSDFNYGMLPEKLVQKIKALCKEKKIFLAADSQSSSQFGNLSKYDGVDFLTPNEREARLALGDFSVGLDKLARSLRKKLSVKYLAVTLGKDGALLKSPGRLVGDDPLTGRVEAFNKTPKDVAGGGDAFLVVSAMALVSGASFQEATFLGACASAVQVSRIGNTPISKETLLSTFVR